MAFSGAKLVLASASPQRKALLESINLPADIVSPADIDETPRKQEKPRLYAQRVATEKAREIAQVHPNQFILAADTIGACGTRILGKADTEEEARTTLTLLSGRRHRVYSGIAVIAPDGTLRERVVLTYVTFKRLSSDELNAYLESEQWRGKSGCYGIQSRAGGFVKSINGSYSNVIGLPLVETRAILGGLGYTPALR